MGEHSVFGGSNASRWLNCPGSVSLLETVPSKPSSAYADEGTLAHEFAAYMLTHGDRSAASYIGATMDAKVGAKPLTEEMASAVQVYLNAVWEEHDKSLSAQLYVEQRFDLAIEGAEGQVGGTNDALVYHPVSGRLVVFDYKHGVGVSVTAEDNDQLKFYATGATFANDTWAIKELLLVIVQPRARDVDELGAVREWPMNPVDLLDFKAECATAIGRARVPDFQGDHYEAFQTGSWCRWCDAAAVCPAKQAEVLRAATLGFADVVEVSRETLPDPKTFDTERLAKIVAGAAVLQSWVNQCQEYLEALLLGGTAVPGWKVVEKIGRAKWVQDEEEIAGRLQMFWDIDPDLVRPRRLVTIGDVEKLMKSAGAAKADIDDFKLHATIKESSGLTIAPESDRRTAVDAAARAFEGVQT